MGEVKKVLFSESLILMQGPSDIMFLKKRETNFQLPLIFFCSDRGSYGMSY